MARAMLSKSLIQFSVDGRGCVPSLLFDLKPNYGGGNKDNGDLLQKVPCPQCYTQCPQPCSRPPPPLEAPGPSWASLGQSVVGSLFLFLRSWCAQGFPLDYAVEVTNRFKGLDLIDRVPDELWTEVSDTVQETGIKTIPMEKKCKKAKWLSVEPSLLK